jgi:hypothetical protein
MQCPALMQCPRCKTELVAGSRPLLDEIIQVVISRYYGLDRPNYNEVWICRDCRFCYLARNGDIVVEVPLQAFYAAHLKKKGGQSVQLNDLKNYDAQRATLPELVELSTHVKHVVAHAEELGVELPEWVEQNYAALKAEIKSKVFQANSAKLQSAKAQLAALATPDEKRAAIQKTIDDLTAKLQPA